MDEVLFIKYPFDDIGMKKRIEDGEIEVVDLIEEQVNELFNINNPDYFIKKPDVDRRNAEFEEYYEVLLGGGTPTEFGEWVYFPWLERIFHVVSRDVYYKILTARNRNLIKTNEQKVVGSASVLIAGLSVGNNIALTLARCGFQNFTLIDADEIALSNLNRVQASLLHLGLNKAAATKRSILEVNPYAKVLAIADDVTPANINSLFQRIDVPSIIIDEIDSIESKVALRQYAKKNAIPTVSGADNGDGCIIDVERYDTNSEQKIYMGVIAENEIENMSTLKRVEKIKLLLRVIGLKEMSSRTWESLFQVGVSLYGWPQLATAVSVNAGLTAAVVRKIILGNNIKSGKYAIDIDNYFELRPSIAKRVVEWLRRKRYARKLSEID